jgi:hypothetical protein
MITSFPSLFDARSPGLLPAARDDVAENPPLGPVVSQRDAVEENEDAGVTTIRRRDPNATPMPAGPTVTAVFCGRGHPSPVTAMRCRACAEEITDRRSYEIARPSLGSLRLSNGELIALDRGVILGRAPNSSTVGSRSTPNQVRLPGPDRDLSRNHVEIRLDGWRVLVVDLNSTNGTYVAPDGLCFTKVPPQTEVEIDPGTVVSLSDITSFRYEVAE